MDQSPKTVYQYSDFRLFLKDRLDQLRAQDPKLTFRAIAKKAGFSSPSFLPYLIEGKRNISSDKLAGLSKALELNREEAQFFKNLAQFNQATDVDERQHFARQILLSKQFERFHPLSAAQYRYYSHWHYVAIRELVSLPGFQEDADWVARMLGRGLSADDAQLAIEELLAMGMLKRNEDGRLKLTEKHVGTSTNIDPSLAAPFLFKFHQEMIRLASDTLPHCPREKREYGALTFGIPKQFIPKLKELIVQFRREIVEVAAGGETPDTVYQLNIQLFPLSEDVDPPKEQDEAA